MLKRVIKSTIDTICEKEKHIKSMKPADSFIVVVVVVISIYIYIRWNDEIQIDHQLKSAQSVWPSSSLRIDIYIYIYISLLLLSFIFFLLG